MQKRASRPSQRTSESKKFVVEKGQEKDKVLQREISNSSSKDVISNPLHYYRIIQGVQKGAG